MGFSWAMRVLVLCLMACNGSPVGPHEGQQAPSFEASLMRGGPTSLASFRGKPTMLVFWASWCGPCRKEAPEVVKIAGNYAGAINVVGINAGESIGTAKRAADQMGITWPVVMDMKGSIQSAYKVSGIPLVLILDGNGVVRHRNNGVPSNVHRLLDGLMQ